MAKIGIGDDEYYTLTDTIPSNQSNHMTKYIAMCTVEHEPTAPGYSIDRTHGYMYVPENLYYVQVVFDTNYIIYNVDIGTRTGLNTGYGYWSLNGNKQGGQSEDVSKSSDIICNTGNVFYGIVPASSFYTLRFTIISSGSIGKTITINIYPWQHFFTSRSGLHHFL